jgi:uncharacterized surface protein with fasciclin (FAS1) repeats
MRKLPILLAASTALALAACGEPATETATPDDAMMADDMAADTATDAGTVVEVAQGNPDFSTLVSAVTSAGLGETLSGAGPFTVFAPNNAAFEKVPQATRDELMSPAGKEDLSGILTYHVVAGELNAQAIQDAITAAGTAGHTLTTVNGATLTATVEGGNVVLTDAAGNKSTVSQTDIDASNGVIHVIDTVLMPA